MFEFEEDFEDEDELDNLDLLFDDGDLGCELPTKEQLTIMFNIFKEDIISKPPIIKGVALTYNRDKSRHRDFRNLPEGFVHCITRESKYSGKRSFDKERAQKIHWIKPIIENVNNPKIKYFEAINDKGKNQLYFWFESKQFIVIIREKNPNLLLITTFHVDKNNKTYKNFYEQYSKR